MFCHKNYICGNYPTGCRECQSMADCMNAYPNFVQKKNKVVKYKIFFGNSVLVSADAMLNNWLKENPGVRMISWQYSQARMGDHSICIEYEEEE